MNPYPSIGSISRRQFLKYSALLPVSFSTTSLLSGCAVDPVTGKKQLMMVSRQQEIDIDRQQSPFQFSSDYGIAIDKKLNNYVSDVGKALLPHVHRLDMPYNFNCVNATYVNAYAFPGGSIAATRGILLQLDNEAQLAALLGHELGHVNARHTAEQMSKGQLSSLFVSGISAVANTQGESFGELTQQLGMLGQGLLLSKYSRDNEREADALGNEYMVKAGYPSKGFLELMQMLDAMDKGKSNAVQVLFSTHPMSSERLTFALQREKGIYNYSKDYPLKRERYMDNTASLRALKNGIEFLQQGEEYMMAEKYDDAGKAFKNALNKMPGDYTAHILMAKCLLTVKKNQSALSHAETAKQIYPSELQGYYLAGMANISLKKYGKAYIDFNTCNNLLPGNPQMIFYKGYCLDKTGDKTQAADNYKTYLKQINYQSNTYSKYAYKRLKQWGYAN